MTNVHLRFKNNQHLGPFEEYAISDSLRGGAFLLMGKLLATVLLLISIPSVYQAQSGAGTSTTVTSIRRVDFRNFMFPLDDQNAKSYHRNEVRVRNGRFIFRKGADYGPEGFEVTKVIFGDLTGDGREDAAVVVAIGLIDSGTSQQAPLSFAYVYTLSNGRPALLKLLAPDYFDSDANKYYESFFRDGTFLLYAGVTKIENGLLVVESLAGAGRCCPEYEVTMRFRWDGQRFNLVGSPERKRMRQ